MDKLTPEQRKKNMQAVKSTGSQIEQTLAKALWSQGFRYRKNDKSVFGHPDLVFKKHKIAIFCDGEFWHGKDWDIHKHDHKSNQAFWIPKIERNMERDKEVNARLQQEGWTVLRFWESDIKKKLPDCLDRVVRAFSDKKSPTLLP